MMNIVHRAPHIDQIKCKEPVSEERKNEVIAWCNAYQKKYPHIKPARIARKAAAYFKL